MLPASAQAGSRPPGTVMTFSGFSCPSTRISASAGKAGSPESSMRTR
jgi:hypothetical protein